VQGRIFRRLEYSRARRNFERTDGARTFYDARAGGDRKRHQRQATIIVTEIPYQVNKARLIERIAIW